MHVGGGLFIKAPNDSGSSVAPCCGFVGEGEASADQDEFAPVELATHRHAGCFHLAGFVPFERGDGESVTDLIRLRFGEA